MILTNVIEIVNGDLSEKVNAWILKNTEVRVIDIKYQVSGAWNEASKEIEWLSGAFIMYEEI